MKNFPRGDPAVGLAASCFLGRPTGGAGLEFDVRTIDLNDDRGRGL